MSKYRCLDLFSGLGGFSSALEDSNNWEITTVDVEPKFNPDICTDIYKLRPSDLDNNYDLILASPPCTEFSTAGNHNHWDFDNKTPDHPNAKDAVGLVYHTIGLINALSPTYWFLENPQGRLRWFLGKPTGKVTYCQYGRDYMKRTDLWGNHPPMTYKRCQKGSKCHTKNVEYDGTSATRVLGKTKPERAKVPFELSESIMTATENAIRNPPPTQQTFSELNYAN